ncbi:MAG: hypothetical protein ACYDH3_12430 [Candidatus Aminicenantales bacterium]
MGQQATADVGLQNFLKVYYTTHKVENLYFVNSPLNRMIPRTRFNGKSFLYSLPYARGGGTSGDATKAVASVSGTTLAAEAQVKPGKIFSVFNITQSEYLATIQNKGAYLPAAVLKMFNATEGQRKAMGACLWGYGYGDIGQVKTAALISATTMTLTSDQIVKLDIGSQLQFTVGTTALPNEAYITGGPYTVSAIQGNVITINALAAAVPVGAWIEMDGSTNPNMPGGILAQLPIIGNRSGTPWTTWLGTTFNNVARNVAPERLAGWFFDGSALSSYRKTILNGEMYARRYGSDSTKKTVLVMNDNDYLALAIEADAKMTYWQDVENGTPKGEGTMGFAAFKAALSTSWIQDIIPDPFAPSGYGFFLDLDTWELISFSNVDTPANDGVTDWQPGVQAPGDINAPDITSYKFLIDEYLTMQPGAVTSEGTVTQGIMSGFFNYVCYNPAHNGVVRFV